MNKFIFSSKPQKFSLTYRNVKGEVKFYKEVSPIDITEDSIVGYVFGGVGIRKFKNNGIQDVRVLD